MELVSAAKLAAAFIVLLGASIADVRTRRIPDRFWLLLLCACLPLLLVEMGSSGGWDRPASFLTVPILISGVLFVIYGYPEPKKVLQGRLPDTAFASIYVLSAAGFICSLLWGDPWLNSRVAVSLLFMLIYYAMYSIPLAGARLIHGGADAKCLIALAAVFPWYPERLPFQIGAFYDALGDMPALGNIFTFHLSILVNAAVLTGCLLIVVLPVINIARGDLSLRMFTSYRVRTEGLHRRHVWALVRENGKMTRTEPTTKLERELKRKGEALVWVTPKVPFILSLTIGLIVQAFVGNIIMALLL